MADLAKNLILVLLAVVVAFTGWQLYLNYMSTQLPTTTIKLGDTTITVEVASTDATREKGLGGREKLPDGRGLFMQFDSSDRWGIWMKDMKFAIDIIWLDDTYKVVTIAHNVQPSTYSSDDPTHREVFYPTYSARYVVEVPEDFAFVHHIYEGTVGSVK